MEISMISADLSAKQLGPSGASVLAAFLPKCTYVPCLYPLWILQSDIPNTLSDIRALMSLNLANNNLGELVLPKGWTKTGDGGMWDPFVFKHADGREQKKDPGSKPEGIISIASVISDMGALTSLNLSSNDIGGHRDNNGQWIVTSEGMFVVVAIFVPHSRCIQCRPSCYR
jgi:hypothetical protein